MPGALAHLGGVTTGAELVSAGISKATLRAQLDAHRWQRYGRAVVLHNSELTQWQQRRVALVNCGRRSLLTSFTSAEELGLRRWERKEVHVLVPNGTSPPLLSGLIVHTTGHWDRVQAIAPRRLHGLAQSLVLAASSFRSSRPATGILAAAVQQRLIRPDELRAAL